MKDDLECHENKLTNHNRQYYATAGFGPRLYNQELWNMKWNSDASCTKRSVNNIHGSVSISIRLFSSFAKELAQSPLKLEAVT